MTTTCEVIYPVDFQSAGHIVDDVRPWSRLSHLPSHPFSQHMHDIMVRPLPPGCRLTAIFDVSCYARLLMIYLTLF